MTSTVPIPVTRKLNVKAGTGRIKVMGVARENYLRSDIPCLSELCFEGCNKPSKGEKGSLLPSNVTHYLLPLEDVVKEFFSILELPEIRGIIFLQSIVNSIQQSLKKYRKVCDLVHQVNKGSIFFPNEFSRYTNIKRNNNSISMDEFKAKLGFRAANWYYEHLGGQKPIIIITEDRDIVKSLESERLEIFVLSLKDYLQKFWPTLATAHDIYDNITETLLEDSPKSDDYADYIKLESLDTGIRLGKYIRGMLTVNKHHASREAFVRSYTNNDGEENCDILISGMIHRNRAVHGDEVAVKLLPKSEWKPKLNKLTDTKANKEDEVGEEEKWDRNPEVIPTGKVVGILTRNWGEYVATIPKIEATTLNKKSGKRILVIPYDYRIPKIRILTSQAQKLVNERIVVRIDNWPINSQYPNGHFVKTLGKIGTLETELEGILLENDITISPFAQGINAEMPPEDWKPSEEELSARTDLRTSHMVMSIDPKGCEDVDDTLSIRKLTNGNDELGVHIADVTHFVPFNSLTDLEARKRATTVYLADRRYDMLPRVLSSNVCSLLGGVDRFAVSVLWELDPKTHQVISVWYGRTVICSSYKLSYKVAQDLIYGVKTPEEIQKEMPEWKSLSGQGLQKKYKQLRHMLLHLSSVAQSIQDRREKSGALKLESSEVQFEFISTDMNDMKAKEHLKVHDTVAECMIFANHWVAKKIAKTFPDRSLLRRHPHPKKENFEELKKCAASKGWRIEIWGNRVLSDSLNECQDPNDSTVNFLLRSLATYAMVQALYFSTGSEPVEKFDHYGLALTHYTHFTSPIRRYADVIVHRLLISALENQDWWSDSKTISKSLFSNTELQKVCGHINECNRSAQNAQRSSQILFQTLYFKDKLPQDPRCIVDAVIFSIRSNGFLVYIPRYALKGPVFMQNQDGEILFYKRNVGPFWTNGTLTQTDHSLKVKQDSGSSQEYRLFDHVTVTIQMLQSDAHPSKLMFYLLSKRPLDPVNDGSQSLEKGEINFLKEIQKEKSEILSSGTGDIDEDMDIDVQEQKERKRSMYEFFQNMRQIGLLSLE